jgi:hypothetical protein
MLFGKISENMKRLRDKRNETADKALTDTEHVG